MLFSGILVCSLMRSITSWSAEGHQIISHTAWSYLTPNGRRFWSNHAGDEDEYFAIVSTWADSDAAERKYPGSSEFHFSHTPNQNCKPFDFKRDCGFNGSGKCIVSGISTYIEYLLDPEVSRDFRVDAFRFIIHFLGDIHQPLHTGFARDAGGNHIPLLNPGMSLHDLWDYAIINNLKPGSAGTWKNVAEHISTLLSLDHSLYEEILSPVLDLESLLETEDKRMQYASILATETSTQSTCKFAYQDESGIYIQPNATISDAYMESRGKIVIRQLARAGVRLADLINVVSELFYERKEELRIAAHEEALAKKKAREEEALLAEQPIAPPSSSNRFSVLSLDIQFDAEEICHDELLVSENDTALVSPKKTLSKRKPRKSRTPVASHDIGDLDSLVLPKTSELDITTATLIKRRDQFYITSIDLVTCEYEPVFFNTYKVVFTKNASPDPITFHFDAAMFGKRKISKSIVIQTLMYLRTGEIGEILPLATEPESAAAITSVEEGGYVMPNFGVRPDKSGYVGISVVGGGLSGDEARRCRYLQKLIAKRRNERLKKAHKEQYLAQLELVGPDKQFKTLSDKWDFDFFSKLSKITVFLYEHVQVFISIDSLSNKHMRFSQHNLIFNGGNYMMLMDTAIYDGDLTPRIKRGMEIASVKNEKLSNANRFTRPTLAQEMKDIDLLFFDPDPDRITRVRAVRNFFAYPGDEESSYFVFEWDLE